MMRWLRSCDACYHRSSMHQIRKKRNLLKIKSLKRRSVTLRKELYACTAVCAWWGGYVSSDFMMLNGFAYKQYWYTAPLKESHKYSMCLGILYNSLRVDRPYKETVKLVYYLRI